MRSSTKTPALALSVKFNIVLKFHIMSVLVPLYRNIKPVITYITFSFSFSLSPSLFHINAKSEEKKNQNKIKKKSEIKLPYTTACFTLCSPYIRCTAFCEHRTHSTSGFVRYAFV
jgi:hypothetical protein